MPRRVKELKQNTTIRIKPSRRQFIREEAKKHNTTTIKIIENGVDLYLKYLNGDLEITNK